MQRQRLLPGQVELDSQVNRRSVGNGLAIFLLPRLPRPLGFDTGTMPRRRQLVRFSHFVRLGRSAVVRL